jgi:hypothetical protein
MLNFGEWKLHNSRIPRRRTTDSTMQSKLFKAQPRLVAAGQKFRNRCHSRSSGTGEKETPKVLKGPTRSRRRTDATEMGCEEES